MPGGVKRVADICLPVDKEMGPVGAVIEHVAYGEHMGTQHGDDLTAAWSGPRRIALVSGDVRASGELDETRASESSYDTWSGDDKGCMKNRR